MTHSNHLYGMLFFEMLFFIYFVFILYFELHTLFYRALKFSSRASWYDRGATLLLLPGYNNLSACLEGFSFVRINQLFSLFTGSSEYHCTILLFCTITMLLDEIHGCSGHFHWKKSKTRHILHGNTTWPPTMKTYSHPTTK